MLFFNLVLSCQVRKCGLHAALSCPIPSISLCSLRKAACFINLQITNTYSMLGNIHYMFLIKMNKNWFSISDFISLKFCTKHHKCEALHLLFISKFMYSGATIKAKIWRQTKSGTDTKPHLNNIILRSKNKEFDNKT